MLRLRLIRHEKSEQNAHLNISNLPYLKGSLPKITQINPYELNGNSNNIAEADFGVPFFDPTA